MEKELGEDEEQGGPAQNKWGIGGINRPDRGTYCPLHFAVRERHSVGALWTQYIVGGTREKGKIGFKYFG